MNHNISLVVTSCGRHDLLRQTLDTFVRCADVFPVKTVIIEDDPGTSIPDWLEYPQLEPLVWLHNNINMGQACSIDRAYAEIETEYIFHCEDDWRFLLPGPFIADSLAILSSHPKVSMVTLTNHKSWMFSDTKYPFLLSKPSASGQLFPVWDGLSFNPGARRLSDYKRMGSFQQLLGRNAMEIEMSASSSFRRGGYVMADLGVMYVEHQGFGRSCDKNSKLLKTQS